MHMRDLVGMGHHFLPSEPTKWNVEDVYEFIRSLPGEFLGNSFPDGLTEREWGTLPPSRRKQDPGCNSEGQKAPAWESIYSSTAQTPRTELERALAGQETACGSSLSKGKDKHVWPRRRCV